VHEKTNGKKKAHMEHPGTKLATICKKEFFAV
jgi:hypothetical protein